MREKVIINKEKTLMFIREEDSNIYQVEMLPNHPFWAIGVTIEGRTGGRLDDPEDLEYNCWISRGVNVTKGSKISGGSIVTGGNVFVIRTVINNSNIAIHYGNIVASEINNVVIRCNKFTASNLYTSTESKLSISGDETIEIKESNLLGNLVIRTEAKRGEDSIFISNCELDGNIYVRGKGFRAVDSRLASRGLLIKEDDYEFSGVNESDIYWVY